MARHLFQAGQFTLHSGAISQYKVECDALTPFDWETIARMVRDVVTFRAVEGVPRGGLSLAWRLQAWATDDPADPLLIVDDVLTTGASMEAHRAGREAVGVVVFARGPLPPWVRALWQWGL